MALTIKTIVKIFMIFVAFQLCLNSFIEIVPDLRTLSDTEEDYLTFLTDETNIIDTEQEGQTLLQGFISSMETQDLFNDGIIESFLGIAKILGEVILFIIEVALLILITPSIFINILLYGFIGSSTLITAMSLIVNIGFYMTMFYIILRERTKTG